MSAADFSLSQVHYSYRLEAEVNVSDAIRPLRATFRGFV